MYATTSEEVVHDSTIITSTLLINFASTIDLFDSGNTHTFIAKKFVDRINVTVEDLGYDLVALAPARAVLPTGV